MPNALKVTAVGADPLASDVAQLANLFNAALEAGLMQLSGPQSTPAAPTVTDAAVAGNLNGAYLWKVVLVTGWKQSDGSYYVSGFAPSAESASLSLTNSQASLSNIGTGTIVVIGRAIYRTAAGGAAGTEKFAGIIWDNGTTTWTDNVADASLGTGMPSSSSSPAAYGTAIPASVPATNTTGTSLSGTIDATSLGGILAANFIRGDSGAPNPQTIANAVTFNSEITAAANITLSAAFLTASVLPNQTQIMQSTSTVNGVEGSLFAIAEAGVAWKVGINSNGDLGIGGGMYTYQGQLGSASGTWTPASGSLNVAVGTVINVASIPSAAKFFDTVDTTGQLNGAPNIGQFQMSGIMQSSGAAGQSSNSNSGNTGVWSASGISSTTISGSTVAVCDGTYYANGYYQLNGGYLQFVVTSIANTSNNASTVKWGVA